MATATERKFTSLRKRLDQMGYRQPLVIDSLPLVDKLFADLMHTTESLKNAKLQLGKNKEQKVHIAQPPIAPNIHVTEYVHLPIHRYTSSCLTR